jgi:hypothetical protein
MAMISVDRLVDMVCTDAIRDNEKGKTGETSAQPIDYKLELMKTPKGEYEWIED